MCTSVLSVVKMTQENSKSTNRLKEVINNPQTEGGRKNFFGLKASSKTSGFRSNQVMGPGKHRKVMARLILRGSAQMLQAARTSTASSVKMERSNRSSETVS